MLSINMYDISDRADRADGICDQGNLCNTIRKWKMDPYNFDSLYNWTSMSMHKMIVYVAGNVGSMKGQNK